MSELVRTHRDGDVLVVEIDNPPVNALGGRCARGPGRGARRGRPRRRRRRHRGPWRGADVRRRRRHRDARGRRLGRRRRRGRPARSAAARRAVPHAGGDGDSRHRARRRPRAGDGRPLPRGGRRRAGRTAGGEPRDHPGRRRHAAAAAPRRRGEGARHVRHRPPGPAQDALAAGIVDGSRRRSRPHRRSRSRAAWQRGPRIRRRASAAIASATPRPTRRCSRPPVRRPRRCAATRSRR